MGNGGSSRAPSLAWPLEFNCPIVINMLVVGVIILRLLRVVAYRRYIFLVPSRDSALRSRFWLKRSKAGVLPDPVALCSGVDMQHF